MLGISVARLFAVCVFVHEIVLCRSVGKLQTAVFVGER